MKKSERMVQAKQLKANRLLPEILASQKADIIQQWQQAGTPADREALWQAQRQLEKLAGAIEDGIKRAINGS